MIRRFVIALERIADALEALVKDDKKLETSNPPPPGKTESNPLPPGKIPDPDDEP